MEWTSKCIRTFLFLAICTFSHIKCDGELVIIHQPPIITVYDETPVYMSELRYVFGSCLGYLQGTSSEWHEIHYSPPFDFHNVVMMVAVVPGIETLNVTGIKRIPLMEDEDLNKTFTEIDLTTTTTKLFKERPLKGLAKRFDLTKVEKNGNGVTSHPVLDSAHEFYKKIEADMPNSLTDGVPHFYWGDFPYFDNKTPENLEAVRSLLEESTKSLAGLVKEPRKALVALITHEGIVKIYR